MNQTPVYPKPKPPPCNPPKADSIAGRKVSFSSEERETLERFFKKTKDWRAKMRSQGVLLRAKGYSLQEITNILGKKEGTIRGWTRAFREHGVGGLIPKPQPGNHRRLTKEQKEEIKAVIKSKEPRQLDIRTRSKTKPRFWNVPVLKNFIKEQYSIEYQSDRSYHRLLHYCGFSFHKPVGNDKRQDPEKVKKFEEELKQKLEQIREDEKRGIAGVSLLPMKRCLNTRPV